MQAAKASVNPFWSDPLVPIGFLNRVWHYGSVVRNAPDGTDFVVLPMVSLLNPKADAGLSLVFSPDDVLLNADLAVSASGSIRWTRLHHRLGGGKTVSFTCYLVPHEASWRGGLRFLTARFPQYFEPPNPRARQIAGCGRYAGGEQEIDVAKFRKMAFGFNWKLSDDFPYMGMFIPPVKSDGEKWNRSCASSRPRTSALRVSAGK